MDLLTTLAVTVVACLYCSWSTNAKLEIFSDLEQNIIDQDIEKYSTFLNMKMTSLDDDINGKTLREVFTLKLRSQIHKGSLWLRWVIEDTALSGLLQFCQYTTCIYKASGNTYVLNQTRGAEDFYNMIVDTCRREQLSVTKLVQFGEIIEGFRKTGDAKQLVSLCRQYLAKHSKFSYAVNIMDLNDCSNEDMAVLKKKRKAHIRKIAKIFKYGDL